MLPFKAKAVLIILPAVLLIAFILSPPLQTPSIPQNKILRFDPPYEDYIDVSSCSDLSQQGKIYVLSSDITNSPMSNCITVSANDIIFDCQGHEISGNRIASYGIYIYRSSYQTTNVTIRNCILKNWNTAAIYLYASNGNKIENTTLLQNYRGIYFLYSNSNTVSDTLSANNTEAGFYSYGSSQNLFLRSTSYNNTYGFTLYHSSLNTISNSSASYNNYGAHFLYSDNNLIKDTLLYDNRQSDLKVGADIPAQCDNTLENVTGSGGRPIGYYNYTATIKDKTFSQLILCDAPHSTLTNITIRGSQSETRNNGFLIYYSDYVTISGANSSYNCNGISIDQSRSCIIRNVTATGNSNNGIKLFHSNNTLIENSFVFNNSNTGAYFLYCYNTTVFSLDAGHNSNEGIYVYVSSHTSISNSSLSGNNGPGINIFSSNHTLINHSLFLSNSYGVNIYSGKHNNISSSVFHPQKWYCVQFDTRCSSNFIFNNVFNCTLTFRYLNQVSGDDRNSWNISRTQETNILGGSFMGGNYYTTPSSSGYSDTCTDSDKDGFCDSAYTLSENNIDYLPLRFVNPYGDRFITRCSTIDSPGTYYLMNDISGAGISHCMDITANNVVLDCMGHTLYGGVNSGYAVFVSRSSSQDTNVTLLNCNVKDWSGSSTIYFLNANKNKLSNIALSGGIEGIRLYSSHNNILRNISTKNNAFQGLYIYMSNNNIVDSLTSSDNYIGLEIYQAHNNTIMDTVLSNNTKFDFNNKIYSSVYCDHALVNVTGSGNRKILYYNRSVTVSNMDLSELVLCNADRSYFHNITVHGSQYLHNNQISLLYTDHCLFDNTTSVGNYNGFYLYNSNNITIINSMIAGNSNHGLYDDGSWQSYPLRIYNNIFNNTDNVYIYRPDYTNYWNTTMTLAKNIIGGHYLGGNYWANPDGTGYSELCGDTDNNGICDMQYNLTVHNIDYLPLKLQPCYGNPSVTLESPPDGYKCNKTMITFRCLSSGLDIRNITLFTNMTGEWEALFTNSSGTSISYTKTGLSEGEYHWNCMAYDGCWGHVWGIANYTLSVDINVSDSRADMNKDGCIQLDELLVFINWWKKDLNSVTTKELMEAISLWKFRYGC